MKNFNQLSRSCQLIFVLLLTALALLACGKTDPTQTKPESTAPTSSESASNPAREKPSMAARIENISIYPVPNRRGDASVSLVVSVRNSGAPSIARKWSLETLSSRLTLPTVLEPVHIGGSVILPGTSNTRVDLAKEDLVMKTAEVPITKDSPVNGILTFVFPKTSESDLAKSKTSFILHFEDDQGNRYQSPRAAIGEKVSQPRF